MENEQKAQLASPVPPEQDVPANAPAEFAKRYVALHSENRALSEALKLANSRLAELSMVAPEQDQAIAESADADGAWKAYIAQRTPLMDTSSNRAIFVAGYSAGAEGAE